jgi:hypothetical protein
MTTTRATGGRATGRAGRREPSSRSPSGPDRGCASNRDTLGNTEWSAAVRTVRAKDEADKRSGNDTWCDAIMIGARHNFVASIAVAALSYTFASVER